jgi:hypothetical protein
MNYFSYINSFEESPLNTLATSPLATAGGEAGAFRSSVFEINKSSSIVNFITHVWSCCSDLLFADWACGPEGRQQVLNRFLVSEQLCRFLRWNNCWLLRAELFHPFLKPKHVSVIDVDPCIEVR